MAAQGSPFGDNLGIFGHLKTKEDANSSLHFRQMASLATEDTPDVVEMSGDDGGTGNALYRLFFSQKSR